MTSSCYIHYIWLTQHFNEFWSLVLQIINLAPGERLSIAVDLAAQDALLKLWNVSNDNRVFPFKNIDIYQESFKNQSFNAQNHSLREVCQERFVHKFFVLLHLVKLNFFVLWCWLFWPRTSCQICLDTHNFFCFSTNLDLYSPEELLMDPIDLEEQAIRYQTKVAEEVGIPYRKRLMHKFSRGTFTANTQRKFVKPIPSKI